MYPKFETVYENITHAFQQWPNIGPELHFHPGVAEAMLHAYGGKRPDSAESMLDTLIHIAIDRAGLIPRDVYVAICNIQIATQKHEVEIAALSRDPDRILEVLSRAQRFPFVETMPHDVVCVYPEHFDERGRFSWTVAFKSRWIAATLAKSLMDKACSGSIPSMSTLLKRLPALMAGQLFKPLAHRALTETVDKKPWILLPMEKDGYAAEPTLSNIQYEPKYLKASLGKGLLTTEVCT